MSRAAHAKTSFASGVLGPRVSRRVDTQHYFNGASSLENWIVLPWGGIERTPGTVFVQEVRNSSKTARLLDFVFNRRQAYILQFNDSKIRFYRDHGIIYGGGSGTAITAITNANPGVVTAAGHGLSNNDIITMSNIDGMEEVNGVEYRVLNVTSTTFSLATLAGADVDTSSYGVFIPGSAVVLLAHLNSNFTDSSASAKTITANGNAAISASQSVFENGSCAFDGTGDYLSVPDSADFDMSGGTWAIDCWTRVTDLSAARYVWSQETDANNYMGLIISTAGRLTFAVVAAGVTVVSVATADGAVATNNWYHMAVCESGNNYYLFVDGQLLATSSDTDRPANYTGTFNIGRLTSSAANDFQGYIDEFRVTKGYVRFSSTIDSYTKLLLHGDNSGASILDASPNRRTVTVNGDCANQATVKKFGKGAISFDGTGDYLTVADSTDFDFSGGVWTVDAWIYPTSLAAASTILEISTDANNNLVLALSATGALLFAIKTASVTTVSLQSGPGEISANEWSHIAVVENGNNYYLFINGSLVASTSDTDRPLDYTQAPQIGLGTSVSYFTGYMDEFRVSKGVARWTADFDAPTAAYLEFTPPTHEGYAGPVVDGIYEISHSYADDELFDIQTAQSADIEYLFHGDHPTMKLSRFDDADWTLEEVDWVDGPYLDENITATTLDPSGTSGSVTVTASAVTGINTLNGVDRGFLSTDVGRLIRYYDGTNYCWLKITGWTSTTVVTATVKGANNVVGASMGGHAANTRWALGCWSETTGYPRTGTFHQGRLYAAATETQPQTCWASMSEDFENMKPGSSDDDGITFTLNTDKVNLINWIASAQRLVIGTSQELFTVFSGALSEPITPTNIQVDPGTSFGSSTVRPIKIGSFLYYMEGDNRRLRELSYTVVSETFNAVNKSILSDHITSGGVVEMAYQQSPYGILWCRRGDGKIATFTREIDQQIEGWTEQVPSGTAALYKSVACIPVDTYDEVWFITSRTINGSTKQYVEYQINPRQSEEADLEDMVLVHSALQYDGSAVSSVSGLDHLEGEDVMAICDGVEVSGTVASGTLSLGASYSTVTVGIESIASGRLLPPEAGSALGTAQGMLKRINEALFSLYRSLGLKVGIEDGNMEELRNGNGVIPTTLQTDDFTIPSTIGWDRDQELYFECDGVFPCTIILVVLFMWASEK